MNDQMTQKMAVRGTAARWVAAGGAALMTVAVVIAATPQGRVKAASADDLSFHQLQAAVETRWHGQEERIPMQWLISGAAGMYTHGGVSRLRLAQMHGLPEEIDGGELEAMAAREMDSGWTRIVRETSRTGRDQSLIYVKPEGKRLAMMVVSFDHGEMDMVEMAIHPEELSQQMHHWEHDSGSHNE